MLIRQGTNKIIHTILVIFETVCCIWQKSEGYEGEHAVGTNQNKRLIENHTQIIMFKSTGEKIRYLNKTCFTFIGLLFSFIAFIHIILFHKVVFFQKIITKLTINQIKISINPNSQAILHTNMIVILIIKSNK